MRNRHTGWRHISEAVESVLTDALELQAKPGSDTAPMAGKMGGERPAKPIKTAARPSQVVEASAATLGMRGKGGRPKPPASFPGKVMQKGKDGIAAIAYAPHMRSVPTDGQVRAHTSHEARPRLCVRPHLITVDGMRVDHAASPRIAAAISRPVSR